jgi:hypothetical protein
MVVVVVVVVSRRCIDIVFVLAHVKINSFRFFNLFKATLDYTKTHFMWKFEEVKFLDFQNDICYRYW